VGIAALLQVALAVGWAASTLHAAAAAAAAARCFQQWGVLTADSAPVLDQLACVLQQVCLGAGASACFAACGKVDGVSCVVPHKHAAVDQLACVLQQVCPWAGKTADAAACGKCVVASMPLWTTVTCCASHARLPLINRTSGTATSHCVVENLRWRISRNDLLWYAICASLENNVSANFEKTTKSNGRRVSSAAMISSAVQQHAVWDSLHAGVS
jgi:hypothetical protein